MLTGFFIHLFCPFFKNALHFRPYSLFEISKFLGLFSSATNNRILNQDCYLLLFLTFFVVTKRELIKAKIVET